MTRYPSIIPSDPWRHALRALQDDGRRQRISRSMGVRTSYTTRGVRVTAAPQRRTTNQSAVARWA